MTHYIKNGSVFRVAADGAIDIRTELPVGTYAVKYDERGGFYYLEEVEGFDVSGKIYGNTEQHADRILNSFEDRPNATGVLLTGEKGSGKTLLAKLLGVEGQKRGYPTIVINQPWYGEEFNGFIQQIEQNTVVIFDEFEKVYNNEKQEAMLTLLDGVYPSKKLFVLTCNDKYRVNSHMKNRPGRLYYRIDYTGLEKEFVVEYCTDNLKDQTQIENVVRVATLFTDFNFDLLKALVEEMNRYGETAKEAMELLNANPESSESSNYVVSLKVKGKEIPENRLWSAVWKGNPLASEIKINWEDPADEDVTQTSRFTFADYTSLDTDTGRFEFKNAKNEIVTLVRVVQSKFNINAF